MPQWLDRLLHPIANAVEDALTQADKQFQGSLNIIGKDVRAAVAEAQAGIKAATPTLEADAKAAIDSELAKILAALVAHNL